MKTTAIISGALLIGLFTGASAINNHLDNQVTESIKSGEKVLFCNFDSGYKKVSIAKFKEFKEVNGKGIYYFTNGQATNCYLEDK